MVRAVDSVTTNATPGEEFVSKAGRQRGKWFRFNGRELADVPELSDHERALGKNKKILDRAIINRPKVPVKLLPKPPK